MEVVNAQLLPMLREKGVTLYWRKTNEFVQTISGIGVSSCKTDGIQQDSIAEGGPEVDGSTSLQDCEAVLSRSHASLTGCLLAHMIPESLADSWLAVSCTHHSLSYLLCSSLIHTSWNKWPLVVDPQDLASQCIKQCSKELVCLDATDR